MSLLEELKRRNVFRVAIAYVILCWLMAQVTALLLDTFGAPAWVLKSLLAMLLIGFPFAVFFAWAFELTPEGIKKEKDVDRTQSITAHTGRKLDFAIIAILVLALGYFAWDKFLNRPETESAAEKGSEPFSQVSPEDSEGAIKEKGSDPSAAPATKALPTDKSIAVLPFENRSKQEDDEYFAAGIHDDLLTQLAQIASLRVISRTSVGQFKNTTLPIRDIAQQLNVATVLEGGVQRAGSQVRINLQLIDAATDTHLWAQTFDRELSASNVFAIQSEIASAVTEALRATLSPAEKSRIASAPTESMAALEEYFKGRAELDQRTQPALESARLRFEHARTIDAEFALALAGEAQAILLLSDDVSSYGNLPVGETITLARPLLARALQVAPEDPHVLAVNGLLAHSAFDFTKAIDFYRRSLALNPSSGEVLNWLRLALFATGDYRGSLDVSARMADVDPLSMVVLYNTIGDRSTVDEAISPATEALLQRLSQLNASWGLSARADVAQQLGTIPDAARLYYLSLEADPGRSANRATLADLLLRLGLEAEGLAVDPTLAVNAAFFEGRWDEAVASAQEYLALNPGQPVAMGQLLNALMWAGQDDAAFALAQQLWANLGQNPFSVDPWIESMAWVAHQSGHPQEAALYREALAKVVQERKAAGLNDNYSILKEAQLAALDGREDAAIAAFGRAIDRGARWTFLGQYPEFATLQDNPGFQAQVSRLRDLMDQERKEIVTMLCGPDSVLAHPTPAPETCGKKGDGAN
jgi:TolB-like protein